mgnify:CR=1 FL=1
MEYVLSFKSTNTAIQSERYLLDNQLRVTVMPLPPQIQAGCGICLRIRPEEIGRADQIILDKKVEGTRLYEREKMDGQYIYREITERDALWNND